MSTKTNFKRIALVAVAALGLGVLSSVPSQAAVSPLTLTVVDGTSSFTKSDSTTAATLNITGLLEAGDSITITTVTKSVPASAGGLLVRNLDSATPVAVATYRIDTQAAGSTGNLRSVAAPDSTNIFRAVTSALDTTTSVASVVRLSQLSNPMNINHTFGWQLDTATARVAGTHTYTLLIKVWDAGSANSAAGLPTPTQTYIKEFSIVVTADGGVSTTPSAATSFVNILSAAQSSGSNATDAVLNTVATASTVAGYIYVGNRNAANGATTAQDSITATVTGAGQVCSTAAPSTTPTAVICGKSLKVSAIGDYQFILQASASRAISL